MGNFIKSFTIKCSRIPWKWGTMQEKAKSKVSFFLFSQGSFHHHRLAVTSHHAMDNLFPTVNYDNIGCRLTSIVSNFSSITVTAYNRHPLRMFLFSYNAEMNIKDTPILVPSSTCLFSESSSNINFVSLQCKTIEWASIQSIPTMMS